ncbi:hypothetical protein DL93DRAFT_2202579 [Clavulina sp. PMI_390]|nr:hypothetical protein DL93DRAFT_2202579 [Clavulina sp. PMI_390]
MVLGDFSVISRSGQRVDVLFGSCRTRTLNLPLTMTKDSDSPHHDWNPQMSALLEIVVSEDMAFCRQPLNCIVLSKKSERARAFYYRIFDTGLAVASSQRFDDVDVSLGRILVNRVAPPRDIKAFRLAVSRLESIPISRFASVRLGEAGEELEDNAALVPHGLDAGPPACTPDEPFTIFLSAMYDGIAEPVMQRSAPHIVKWPGRPVGWRTAQIGLSEQHPLEVPFSGITAMNPKTGKPDNFMRGLTKGCVVFFDPESLCTRNIYGKTSRTPSYRVILRPGRELGYVEAANVHLVLNLPSS